jgi:hypothetical protein
MPLSENPLLHSCAPVESHGRDTEADGSDRRALTFSPCTSGASWSDKLGMAASVQQGTARKPVHVIAAGGMANSGGSSSGSRHEPLFFNITGDDWARAVDRSIRETNSVAEQIRAAEMELR